MKRISEYTILNAYYNNIGEVATLHNTGCIAVAETQLQSCQKELEGIIREG